MSRSKYVSVGDTGGLILDSKYDDFATNAGLQSIKNEIVSAIEAGNVKVQLSGATIEDGQVRSKLTGTDIILPVRIQGNLVQATSPGLVTQVLKYPDPARPKVSLTTTSIAPNIFAKDAETGREYVTAYGRIRYNDSDGEGDWPIMWTTPEDRKDIRSARRLSNGRILVALKQDAGVFELWASDLSEDTTKTFEKVLEFADGYPYGPWGWDTTHEEILLCSEYMDGNTNRAYMSRDNGLTWEKIFQGPDPTDGRFHIHSLAYDPYHSTIWIVTGDGKYRNIYYSYDWGNVWHTMWPEGTGSEPGRPIQGLSISVMPHCILFGTDSKPDGIWRLQKKWRRGSYPKYTAEDLEYVYAVYEENRPGISQIFHSPVVVDGIHYHATWTSTNDRLCSHIIATPDGEHFYDVYKSKPFTQQHSGVRFLTTDGKALIGAYRDEDNRNKRFYMPLPDWKAI